MSPSLDDALSNWMPRQRWFAGKGRGVRRVSTQLRVPLGEPPPPESAARSVEIALVAVEHADSAIAYYHVPLSWRAQLDPGLEASYIGDTPDGRAYDAPADPWAARVLLEALRTEGELGALSHGGGPLTVPAGEPVGMTAEQSNTSVIYGQELIVKYYRRLWPGPNPELELGAALHRAGSRHIAPPLAWLSGPVDGVQTTLAIAQPYLRSATEGWRLAQASVRDLFDEADLHADEVGGDFAGEASRLGEATAEVHQLLAAELGAHPATAAELADDVALMHHRLDLAIKDVPALREYATAVHAHYDQALARPGPATFQRIHGDLHLGQVLRTDEGWVLIDFEGEPARPLAERTVEASPMRDVAGMLRSFDYAARHLLVRRSNQGGLAYRATEWALRNRAAFCRGYATGGVDPADEENLVRAYELDKAVYEAVYEARNRPTWVEIPLGAIERLTA